ncbi:hypothetical protein CF15_07920 [Pyrodictium occultum]|uniref:Peptidase M48 domain-containing protein n=1 Tax=Pyrodictium occultum TaxID=2309 RepID=A0A0V8RRI7_PYROC|nr:M48 family metalloprotease [Pyrodictium occultum]KSW10703.1 hypothetical protein CF15_07920 [Pyrodictium occultum]
MTGASHASLPGAAFYAGIVLATALPGLYVLVLRGDPEKAWARLRALMAAALAAGALMAAGGGGVDPLAAAMVGPALGLVYLAISWRLGRRTLGSLVYRVGGRLYRVFLLSSGLPTAFTVAALGRIYVSRGLYERLRPEEAGAVVAHEAGHLEALRPLPPLVLAGLVALLASWLVAAAMRLAGAGPLGAAEAAAMLLAAGLAWVSFSWAWEHLADIYSLRAAGAWSISALYRMTGALPEEPVVARAYLDALLGLRPRRGPGVVFLVNPHPRPGHRLYLMERLAWLGRGLL